MRTLCITIIHMCCCCVISIYLVDSFYFSCTGNTTCTSSTFCSSLVSSSDCTTGVCRCVDGYLTNNTIPTCLHRQLRDPCEVSKDCYKAINLTVCVDKACICQDGYRQVNSNECEPRKIGDSDCVKNTDCSGVIVHSLCQADGCACARGYQSKYGGTTCECQYTYGSTCLEVKIGASSCTNTSNCLPVTNTKCSNQTCVCDDGYYAINGGRECQTRSQGDNCQVTSDCEPTTSNSICSTDGVCQCQPGYRSAGGKTQCEKGMTIFLIISNSHHIFK